MTEQQRIVFIKNKLAPIFKGMNAKDALEIVEDTYNLRRSLFSWFTLSSSSQKKEPL